MLDMKKTLTLLLVCATFTPGVFALQDHGRRGSIYDADEGPFGLIGTRSATRTGDLVTIAIQENQNGKNEESSDLSKGTSLDYQLTNFDIAPKAFSTLPRVAATSDDQFRGTANYAKKGTFTARVTAIVVDVLPNGNMIVNGRREIRIDKETKLIEFSGIIRRWDITPD